MSAPLPEPLPEPVRAAGATAARELDVRPILARGGDPFSLIVETVRTLGEREALCLFVGFEPAPLYAVLRSMGYAAHTESAAGVFHVWFYRDGSAPESQRPAPGGERVPLKAPVRLDVRGLEPPQPMMAILEKLVELGPGAQLLVTHHREPMHLYEKLELRGYGARTERRAENEYLVHIAPAWVFEPKAG